MKGTYKEFDDNLYKKYDEPAKQAVIQYLNNLGLGIKAVRNFDNYKVDIILYKINGEKIGFVEVEVKDEWVGEFRYDTVHILERKEKFITHRTVFFVLDKYMQRAIVAKGDDVKASPLVEVPNRLNKEGELFFDVPMKLCKIVNLMD